MMGIMYRLLNSAGVVCDKDAEENVGAAVGKVVGELLGVHSPSADPTSTLLPTKGLQHDAKHPNEFPLTSRLPVELPMSSQPSGLKIPPNLFLLRSTTTPLSLVAREKTNGGIDPEK